jgi:hypothetical protein
LIGRGSTRAAAKSRIKPYHDLPADFFNGIGSLRSITVGEFQAISLHTGTSMRHDKLAVFFHRCAPPGDEAVWPRAVAANDSSRRSYWLITIIC